jgi:hypothetical protein
VPYELKYRSPGPVASEFIRHRPEAIGSTLPIDGIIGPIGSGKSVAACMRIFLHSLEQPVWKDGWRRAKWAVVRNTNPELELTTIPTWLKWFPEDVFGKFSWSPPYTHHIVRPDLKLEIEVIFFPLDRPDQIRKLLSLELTGGFVNEAREVAREIVVELRSRCGRWPAKGDTMGVTGWAGVIFDTNMPPDEHHYLMYWSGRTEPPDWMDTQTRRQMFKPENISVFFQPPAMIAQRDGEGNVRDFALNPAAENLDNLREGYYEAQLSGQTTAWVLNMLGCEARAAGATRPVHPTFRRAVHVAPGPLEWDENGGHALFGMDFARNPALLLAQDVGGQLRYLREWVGSNVSVEQFLAETIPQINAWYPAALGRMRGWGDPSGTARTGADDMTPFIMARRKGLPLVPAWTNDPDERQASLDRRLDRSASGRPSVVFCPRGCPTTITGLEGGYRFRRLKVTGTFDQFTDEIDKSNPYSHPCEAAQYITLNLDRGATASEGQRRAEAGRAQPNGAVRVDPLALARMARRGMTGPSSRVQFEER